MIFKLDEDGHVMHFFIEFEEFDIIRKYLEWRVCTLRREAEESVGKERTLWRKHHKAMKLELESLITFERICRHLPNEQESKEQVAKAE